MRKSLAGTERLAKGKECCLLQFCSDMVSDMETTDPEEVDLTVPVKERHTLDGCGFWTPLALKSNKEGTVYLSRLREDLGPEFMPLERAEPARNGGTR